MKDYDWILFDADETLFHFDAFSGLQRMFSHRGIQFTQQHYQDYQTKNKSLWVDYQNGDITALQLQHERFSAWAAELNVLPQDLNSAFLAEMIDVCHPLAGAVEVLQFLKDRVKLGIITNGFTELQHARLRRTGLRDYFDLLVISEQVGIAKPHPGIFEYTLTHMGNPNREQVLMVGDTLESDILGGINAGLDTCWFNADNKPQQPNIIPRYQISALTELIDIFRHIGKTKHTFQKIFKAFPLF